MTCDIVVLLTPAAPPDIYFSRINAVRLLALASGEPIVLSLTSHVSIGSAPDNNIVITHSTVSRHHARLIRTPEGYQLLDRGSTNGSYVNNRRASGPTPVRSGDELRFGTVAYRLVFDSGASRPDGRASEDKPFRSRRWWLALAAVLIGGTAIGFAVVAYFTSANSQPKDHLADNTEYVQPRSVPSTDSDRHVGTSPKPTPVLLDESGAPWLRPLNYYRTMAGVAPVLADPSLSDVEESHSRYLVENFADRIRAEQIGAEAHTEAPGMPGYTPEGAKAAAESDVYEAFSPPGAQVSISFAESVQSLMSAPFHRLSLLNPDLRQIAYGQFCHNGVCASALDVATPPGSRSLDRIATTPIEFPPDGSRIKLHSFHSEWPNPLPACPGYESPTGLPVTLQLGLGADAKLGASSLVLDGANPRIVETCAFDADTYANPNPAEQNTGRNILNHFGAVVLIPRQPLEPGTYTVSITLNHPYRWTYTIEGSRSPQGEEQIR